MADVLVQTRIDKKLAAWLAKRARAEGESAASWLRKTILEKQHESEPGAFLECTVFGTGEPVSIAAERVEAVVWRDAHRCIAHLVGGGVYEVNEGRETFLKRLAKARRRR